MFQHHHFNLKCVDKTLIKNIEIWKNTD